MTWLRIDDGFPYHPKVLNLSDRAFRAHVTAMCHAARYLTDGAVTPGVTGKRETDELVKAGLWHKTEDGWAINDYLEYNPSRAEVEAERERRSSAGKRAADARWHAKRMRDAYDDASTAHDERTGSSMPRPGPSTSRTPSKARPTDENAKRVEVTHDQLYLAEKLDLTVPAVQKLNTEYGTVIVTDAMRHLHGFPPEEPVESTYAYVKTLCSLKEATA